MTIKNQNRRSFVQLPAGAALASPLLFNSSKVFSQAQEKLAEDDPEWNAHPIMSGWR